MEEVEDRRAAEEAPPEVPEDHQAEEAEDHQAEEAEDHQQEVPVLAQDMPQGGPNSWETPLKYSTESEKEHSCSSRNGRSTGVSIIKST